MSIMSAYLATLGKGWELVFAGAYLSSVGSTPAVTTSVQFATDGSMSYSGFGSASANWINPTSAASGSFEIRATLLSGGPLSSGVVDTWLAMSNARSWGVLADITDPVRVAEVRVEMRYNGGAVIRTQDFTLYAEKF